MEIRRIMDLRNPFVAFEVLFAILASLRSSKFFDRRLDYFYIKILA